MEEVMDKAVKAVREASRREFEEYIKHQEKENEKTRALLRELFGVETAEGSLKRLFAALRRRTQERDRLSVDLQTTQTQVNAARTSIARLESRAHDLQVDNVLVQRLQTENTSMVANLSAVQARCSSLEAERDRAVTEFDSIRAKVAGLMSFVRPATLRIRSASPSPRLGSCDRATPPTNVDAVVPRVARNLHAGAIVEIRVRARLLLLDRLTRI
ncbi:hypothetical protein PF002_g10363 [Phytophthora fragariae]|uniref:Uncharacterized protein n=1 Tax=Phytophthora fragariae TaxID=53985 RepID=A0A6A3ZQ06_9STRA|nr:hypothetical protein PF002_g10363 [Phytophthora fragariae]